MFQVQTINDFGASEWSDVFSFKTLQGKTFFFTFLLKFKFKRSFFKLVIISSMISLITDKPIVLYFSGNDPTSCTIVLGYYPKGWGSPPPPKKCSRGCSRTWIVQLTKY